MASIKQLEKLHKDLFNELNPNEKLEYCIQISKEKYKNYLFISKEGKVTLNVDKHNSIDNLQVFLNANKNVNNEVANASLSVLGDLEALKEQYIEEFEVAYSFYSNLKDKDILLLDYFISFLESFLGAYTEEPSEALYYVLQDVAKGTTSSYNEIKKDMDSYFINISEISEDETLKEEIQQLKTEIEKKYNKYNSLINTILQLDKPSGVKEDG